MNKKNSILNAAIELFAKNGYHDTSTARLAREAGVSEGLIFKHFKNKEEVYVTILKNMVAEYIKGMKAAVQNACSGMNAIEKIVDFHFEITKDKTREFFILNRDLPIRLKKFDSPYRKTVLNVSGDAEFIVIVSDCISRGQVDGTVRQVDPLRSAYVIQALFNGVIRQEINQMQMIPDLSAEVKECCRRYLMP